MSWASTFTRFQTGRFPAIAGLVVRVADWSKPRPGCAPMFEHPVFERLSVAHPLMPALVYGPAIALLLWNAGRLHLATGAVVGCFMAGLFLWSLFEYAAHRLVFHLEPTTPRQVASAYLVHGVHHAFPDDSRRWVMPLVVTIPIALVLFGLCQLVLGRWASPTYAGFLCGYLAYDLLHYWIHRGRPPTRIGRFLRQYHLAHHYRSGDRQFGVTSPLWDVVFRTK